MNTSATPRPVDLGNGLRITVDERGNADSPGVLLLHGGAGPRSVAGLAAALGEQAHVVTPTHPGFDGTPLLNGLDTAGDLAGAYLDLLGALGLKRVTVIGNSLGGWIAVEMALRDTEGRLGAVVLLNAIGIRPDDPSQVTDVRTLPSAEIGRLSFHDAALRPEPAALSEQQRGAPAANREALERYAGPDFFFAAGLREQLHRVAVPVLVAWGMADGVLSPEYGRAYAAAFPNGRFRPIAAAGHFPHIEQPGEVLAAVENLISAVAGDGGA